MNKRAGFERIRTIFEIPEILKTFLQVFMTLIAIDLRGKKTLFFPRVTPAWREIFKGVPPTGGTVLVRNGQNPKIRHQKPSWNVLNVAQNCVFCVRIRSQTQTNIFCNVLTTNYKQSRLFTSNFLE